MTAFCKKASAAYPSHATGESKLPVKKKAGDNSLTSKRQMLIKLYSALFQHLRQGAVVPLITQILNKAPESHIDMEWETVKDGSFQEVVTTLIKYKLDDEDLAHLMELYKGVLGPYIKNLDKVTAEDLKWAYKEILQFVRKIRTKRELESVDQLKAEDKKLLSEIAPKALEPVKATFKSLIAATYRIHASDEWKEDLAFILLASAVASELDSLLTQKDHPDEPIVEELHKDIVSGKEISSALKGILKAEGMDEKKYLDLKQIDDMSAECKRIFGVSLQEIYDEDKKWAQSGVLGLTGEGVSFDDDGGFDEWVEEKTGKKLTNDWHQKHKHFESPYDNASNLVDELIKLKKEENADEAEEEESEQGI